MICKLYVVHIIGIPLASLHTHTILYHYMFINHLVYKQSSHDTNHSTLYYICSHRIAQNKTIKYQFVQSFRNLDVALQQAKQNSLADMNTKEMCDSLTNLDEATALAIQNSLDKSMYESFRNLGGAIEQARNQSLSDSNKSDDSNMFESFRNLEDAMAMAMAASLEEEKGKKQRSSNFGADNCILEGDEDSESEDSVELQQVVKSNSTRKMGKNSSGGDSNNNSSSAGIVHVAEAAPDLERLARRHANRRFEQERVRANDGGEGVTQSMNCGRTRRSGRRISDTDLSGQTEELVEEEGASSSRRRVERRRSSADSLQGRSRRRSASERIELGLTQDLSSREDSAATSSRRGSDESSSSKRGDGERSSSKRTSFVGMVGNELKSGAGLINDLIEPTLEKVLGPPISSSSRGDNNSSRRSSMSSGGTTDDIDADKVEDMHFAQGRRTSALLQDNPLDNKKEKRKKGGSKKKLFGSIKKKSSSKK